MALAEEAILRKKKKKRAGYILTKKTSVRAVLWIQA
jgi:hypothetical protein